MFRARTLRQLAARPARPRRALVGFDGFVDSIVAPVGLRRGPGEDFTPIATLGELGARISAAAGMSTNLELHPRGDKLGGNGPIMANALLALGSELTYVGALGRPATHPVFADLAARARIFSLAEPAHTLAVECRDGKLMLGRMRSLDEITYPRLAEVVGEEVLRAELAGADLAAFVNWTMIPHLTSVLRELRTRIVAGLPAAEAEARRYFFDLADPEKRAVADLRAALAEIAAFAAHGRVTLGLNLKEARQVAAALGVPEPAEDEAALRGAAVALRARLGVDTVVIHPRAAAACAGPEGTAWVPGPFTAEPRLTTGAGDHFNAGFTTGQLLGLDAEGCLTLGVATSGHYVRTGESPDLPSLETFLANWR
jgi:sugar/nucleoside kinase (ribokinase family)